MFACKRKPRHKRITPLFLALLLLLTGCLPAPQRVQSAGLLDQLVAARGMFGAQPPQTEQACTAVGDVQTRLDGEPGLVDVRPAWLELRAAARALQSVCGQNTLLGQPTNDSQALTEARARWTAGIQREISVACDHLRLAAAALERATPC